MKRREPYTETFSLCEFLKMIAKVISIKHMAVAERIIWELVAYFVSYRQKSVSMEI